MEPQKNNTAELRICKGGNTRFRPGDKVQVIETIGDITTLLGMTGSSKGQTANVFSLEDFPCTEESLIDKLFDKYQKP